MKKLFKISAMTAFFILTTYFSQAQPNPWRQGNGTEVQGGQIGDCSGCEGVPIDGGTSVLLICGLIYGITKTRVILVNK